MPRFKPLRNHEITSDILHMEFGDPDVVANKEFKLMARELKGQQMNVRFIKYAEKKKPEPNQTATENAD
jgi:hypothetical protein